MVERRRPFLAGIVASLLALGGLSACAAGVDPPPAAAVQRVVPQSAAELQLSFATVVREVAPAVVNINAERVRRERFTSPLMADPFFRRFFEQFGGPMERERRQASLGSGVVVDPAGLVVTNHHVIAEADAITVILADRREFAARVVRSDAAMDIALLRLRGVTDRLPAVGFADSDTAAVGDLVLAIGNPFGIGQSVSSGIVSAVARSGRGLGLDVPLLQTDAAINPGNSGGALVGIDGRLLGINTAILTRGGGSIGVGFAVPANVVRAYVQGDLAAAPAARPWLGARLQDLDQALAEGVGLERPRGALVAEVVPGAAAAEAGIARGDVLLALDGVPIGQAAEVDVRLALAAAGEAIPVTVWRRGRERTLRLRALPPPRQPPPDPTQLERTHPLAGLDVANLSPSLALEFDRDPFQSGVLVLDVARGSPAARLGFRPGDVIAEIDGRSVGTHDDLDRGLARGLEGRRLVVERGGRRLQLVIG